MYAVSYFPSSTSRMTFCLCIADLIQEQHLTLKHLGVGLVPLDFFGLYLNHHCSQG